MAAPKLNFCKQEVERLTNKNQQTGYLPPNKFNGYAKQAQLEEVIEKLNMLDGGLTNSDEVDELKKTIFLSPNTSGVVSKPSDWMRFDTADVQVFYKKGGVPKQKTVSVDVVSQNEVGDRLSTSFDAPTADRPIVVTKADSLQFYPQTIGNVRVNYIRVPTDPLWDFELQNGRPVYKQATSVDFDLGYESLPSLIWRICGYLGVEVRKGEITQYAEAKIQQNR